MTKDERLVFGYTPDTWIRAHEAVEGLVELGYTVKSPMQTYGPGIPLATLGVGSQPMGIPKPVSLNVFFDGKIIASLDIQQARDTLKHFDDMLARYQRHFDQLPTPDGLETQMTRDEAILYAMQQVGWLSAMHKLEHVQDKIDAMNKALQEKGFAVLSQRETYSPPAGAGPLG